MPNHCKNYMQIKHEDKNKMRVMRKIVKAAAADPNEYRADELFNKIYPVPEGVDEYDWCCDNWNTKWDAYCIKEVMLYGDPEMIELSFLTAWSPPTGVYKKLVADGWDVYAEFYEPGLNYEGFYHNGIEESREIYCNNIHDA